MSSETCHLRTLNAHASVLIAAAAPIACRRATAASSTRHAGGKSHEQGMAWNWSSAPAVLDYALPVAGTLRCSSGQHWRYCVSTSTKRHALGIVGLGLLIAAAGSQITVTGQQSATLAIKEIGSMHVGGGNVSVTGAAMPTTAPAGRGSVPYDPNGDYEAGQMYVQYVKL